MRRWVVSDRFFFVTCRLLPRPGNLQGSEFERLARVARERREKYHFLLTAWVFLPDRAAAGHAIIFPPYPLTISRVMESIKAGGAYVATLFVAMYAPRRGSLCREKRCQVPFPLQEKGGGIPAGVE